MDVVILVINIITRIQFNFVNGLERLAPKKDLNIMKKNFYSMNHKQHPTDENRGIGSFWFVFTFSA